MREITEQEARLIRIVEGANDGLWDWDLITGIVFFNRQSYTLLEIPLDVFSPSFETILNCILPCDRFHTQIAIQALIENGTPYEVEHRIPLKNGSLRYCLCRGRVTDRDANEKPSKISGTITDITELKQTQAALTKNEAHFRFVTDTVPVIIWVTDQQHQVSYINRPWLEFTGQALDEALAFGWLVHPNDRQSAWDSFLKAAQQAEKIHMEYRLLRYDGVYRHMLDVGAPLMEPGQTLQGYIGYVIDITERKEAELALAESENRFKTLAEASEAMIWQTDPQGKLSYQSPKLLQFIGLHLDSLDWTGYIRPEVAPLLLQNLENAEKTKQGCSLEIELWHADSAEYRWVKAAGNPLYDKNGNYLGIVGLAIDIHDMKQAQERLIKITQKLAQSNDDLEQFAAVASHDLKAPLRKIDIFSAQIALEKECLSLESQDALERIQKSMTILQTLIDDLLSWSKVSHTPVIFEPINLSEVLDRVLTNLKPLIQEKQAQLAIGELATVIGDASQLQQLMQNLLENALKYQPPNQIPTIRIEATCFENEFCQITIEDNGIGFPQSQAERIFQPFERLHGKTGLYTGSGVGLAICQRIIERHGGTIEAQGTEGKGASFIIKLPSVQKVSSSCPINQASTV